MRRRGGKRGGGAAAEREGGGVGQLKVGPTCKSDKLKIAAKLFLLSSFLPLFYINSKGVLELQKY